MTKHLIKIKDKEYPAKFVLLARGDINTVRFLVEMSHAEATELFSSPGEWFAIRRHDPYVNNAGEEQTLPDNITDCSEFEVLRSIKDTRDGMLEVVMGKITDSEVLAELMEVLNG